MIEFRITQKGRAKSPTHLEKRCIMEAKIMYRLKYRNGSRGAWSFDKNRIEKNAEFFRAKIETKIYNPNFKGLK